MKKELMSKIVLLTTSVYIGLIVGEAFIHYYFVIPNPIANYYPFAPAKSGSTIKIDQYEFKIDYSYNSQGFRDQEVSLSKPASEKRILFLGDSTTEGFGNQLRERYSNMLIDKLGYPYSGINVAQLATNPDIYFDNLITFGIALHPDFVVMGISLSNDFMGGRLYKIPASYTINNDLTSTLSQGSSGILEYASLNHVRKLLQGIGKKEKFLQKRHTPGNFWDLYFGEKISKKFYLDSVKIDEATFNTLTSSFNQDILREYLTGRIIPTLLIEGLKDKLPQFRESDAFYNDVDYDNTLWYINESNKILKEKGIPLIVLIIPDINQVNHDKFQAVLREDFKISTPPARLNQLGEIRQKINEDLKKESIVFLDITDRLKEIPEETYYLYDQHLAPKGHQVAANELYNLIINTNNAK